MQAVPYMLLVGLFFLFVVWNGSVVLGLSHILHTTALFHLIAGDKSNHVPTAHVPQLFYFYASASAFGWPVLIGMPGGPKTLGKELRRMFFGSNRFVVPKYDLGRLADDCL
jgi:alpha-1,2-glucosyltransferase